MMLTICGSSTLHMRLANPPLPVLPTLILTVLDKLFPPPKYTEAGIGQGSINRCTAHCCQSSIFRPVPVVTTGVKRATGFHMRSVLLLLLQYFKQLFNNQKCAMLAYSKPAYEYKMGLWHTNCPAGYRIGNERNWDWDWRNWKKSICRATSRGQVLNQTACMQEG